MKNLTPSSLDPFTVFREVVKAKKRGVRRSRLNRRMGVIRGYYKEYDGVKRQLELITKRRHKAGQKEDLGHCYTYRTGPLDSLLADIRLKLPDVISNKCQYCNIDSPRTFDHYVPRGAFPEFAIHALNLVPCCDACNQIKGRKFLNGSGERRVVNLYFDRVPKVRYLDVRIDHNPNGELVAVYGLVRPPRLRHKTFQLIQNHFAALNLLKRYKESSNALFTLTKESMRAHGFTQGEVRRFLMDEALMLSTEVSPNHWKAALYDAMANDARYLSQCAT